MGSNSLTSFLTKLLRQDKKEKPKPAFDSKRRHSAPVPDWFEIIEAGQTTVNTQKLPEKQRKQNVKYASQQNLTSIKKQKQARSKQVNDKSKRHSTGFPSWFCVSGNTETLERSPMPLYDNGNNKDNLNNNQKITAKNEKPKVDFIRLKEGKNGKAKENRYSAPPAEWTRGRATSNNEQKEVNGQASKPPVKQVRRELSPGVKYRTDGTLEKPYVFPAGLTFGPDGRRLQLRRTAYSQISEEPSHVPRANEKRVKADVHRSSTEDIIMEYSYEDINPGLGEFDVRKAFYLKYDSDFSETKTQESSVDRDNYRHNSVNYNNDHPYIYRRNTNDWENGANFPQTCKIIVDASIRIEHQNNGNQQEKCRYSIPPKNEDLVYMGSFENLNNSDYTPNENEILQSGLNVGDNKRRSGRDKARSTRNRYSMPIRNSDLIYMGSFENVNQLLTGNTNGESVFSLYNDTIDTDERSQHSGHERASTSSAVQVNQPTKLTSVVEKQDGSVVSGYVYHRRCSSVGTTPVISSPTVSKVMETTSSCSPKNSSMSNRDSAKNLYISKQNYEIDVSLTSGDEEGDVFDASSLSCKTSDKTPLFSRRGRSSCMPGNSRFIAPPPAVSASYISAHSPRSPSLMAGSKPFSLPPPPNYTPPKEEMEFTHAHLKEMNCHKGSQTDLSIDFEHLAMEDRDISLNREDVKTIYAGAVVHFSESAGRDHADRIVSCFEFQNSAPTNKSMNLALQDQMLDNTSDLSHGSDEVFQYTQGSVGEDNDRTKTRRFTKFRSKISSTQEQNKLSTSSSPLCNEESGQKRAITESMTNSKTQSASSCKISSSASKTTPESSSPKSDRQRHDMSYEKTILSPHCKPIPTPRKISYTDTLSKKSIESAKCIESQQSITCNPVPPVPKQRHSLAYSRSMSPSNCYETMSSPNTPQEGRKTNRQQLLRTQSCDQTTTLQKKQYNERSAVSQGGVSQNIYTSIDDEHVYDEIDSPIDVSKVNNSKCENIYEDCENIDSGNKIKRFEKNQTQNSGNKNTTRILETSLSPLQTITLSVSPGQRRRNVNIQKEPATHSIQLSQPQYKCSIAASPVLPDTECVRNGQEKDVLLDVNKQYQYEDSDDSSSIADDEMSLSNEEDMEDLAKRFSMRRCVSADNLLRSGSIIDRSMILAKRRRKQLRERRSKSQLQLHRDTKYDLTSTSFKVHYTKRKRTSKERLFKQKPSHTDSGHDSEIVSPCTSPDTRRHVDNMTSHASRPNDGGDGWMPRNGTLPRKSWEIRMRNTHHLRKCRSRESLVPSLGGICAATSSALESGY